MFQNLELAKDGFAQKEIGFIRKDDGTYIYTKEERSIRVLLNTHFPPASLLMDSEESANQAPGPTRRKSQNG